MGVLYGFLGVFAVVIVVHIIVYILRPGKGSSGSQNSTSLVKEHKKSDSSQKNVQAEAIKQLTSSETGIFNKRGFEFDPEDNIAPCVYGPPPATNDEPSDAEASSVGEMPANGLQTENSADE